MNKEPRHTRDAIDRAVLEALDAEAIRDSMLAVSGELNLMAGGPGFNFFTKRGVLDGFPPVERFGIRPDLTWSLHPLRIPSRQALSAVTVHDLYFLDRPEDTAGEIRRGTRPHLP